MTSNEKFKVNPGIHSPPNYILKIPYKKVVFVLSRTIIRPPNGPLCTGPSKEDIENEVI